MIASHSPQRRTSQGSAVLFLSLFTAAFTAGCKGNQPRTPEPQPAASTSAAAPTRTPVTAPPVVKKHLYSADADPKADIASALKQARHEKKRVILDFGGDWCGDCQVLDIYFHQSPNRELIAKNFLVVYVDVGHMDKNVDVAERYGVPLKKGVPALAVLDARGKVLYSQATGQFGDMRYMQPTSVTEFLNRWKA